jgi:hypothetical protein
MMDNTFKNFTKTSGHPILIQNWRQICKTTITVRFQPKKLHVEVWTQTFVLEKEKTRCTHSCSPSPAHPMIPLFSYTTSSLHSVVPCNITIRFYTQTTGCKYWITNEILGELNCTTTITPKQQPITTDINSQLLIKYTVCYNILLYTNH